MPFASKRLLLNPVFTQPLRGARVLAIALAASTMLAACSPGGTSGQADTAASQGNVYAPSPDTSVERQAALQANMAALDQLKMSAGSDRKNESRSAAMAPVVAEATVARASVAAAAAPAPAPASPSPAPGAAVATGRFLAVRHHMQIESPAAELAGLWESVKSACERLDCYVEGSALQRETSHAAAGAYLTMRVNPLDFALLTANLGGNAKVLNHQTETEDKTSQVIDVEAQIKNRSEYRDSLRELLREKNVKRSLQDLMEIRDTMSQVQAEIDAAATQRSLLERETAKQLVQMQFQPTRVIVSGTYSPWQQTWQRSWDTLARSVQNLVITVAGLLPWLIALVVIGVPVWLGVARRNRRLQAASSVATTTAGEGDVHGADTRL